MLDIAPDIIFSIIIIIIIVIIISIMDPMSISLDEVVAGIVEDCIGIVEDWSAMFLACSDLISTSPFYCWL